MYTGARSDPQSNCWKVRTEEIKRNQRKQDATLVFDSLNWPVAV
jgi:hypothetical protein